MLKSFHRNLWAIALVLPLLGVITALPAQADEEDEVQPNLGICGLYYVSGLMIVGESGELLNLSDYCQVRRLTAIAITEEGDPFWEAFVASASPEAMEFAVSAGKDAVVRYGSTICPYLWEGGSIDELRAVQSADEVPVSFEAAATVAAINTYCPEYQSNIGR